MVVGGMRTHFLGIALGGIVAILGPALPAGAQEKAASSAEPENAAAAASSGAAVSPSAMVPGPDFEFVELPDCGHPAGDVEAAICNSRESRGLFENVARKYRELIAENSEADDKAIRQAQIAWYREMAEKCVRPMYWQSQSNLVDNVATALRADCVYQYAQRRQGELDYESRRMLPPVPTVLNEDQPGWGERLKIIGTWDDQPMADPLVLERDPVFGYKRPFDKPPDFKDPRATLEAMGQKRDTIAKATHLTSNWGPAGATALDEMMNGYRACISAMQNVSQTRGPTYNPDYARSQWLVCATGVAEAIRIAEPYQRAAAKAPAPASAGGAAPPQPGK